MKIIPAEVPDVLIIEPEIFGDHRGFFTRASTSASGMKRPAYTQALSRTTTLTKSRWVLRGLHYQLPPAAQGKLVRCVVGEVFDVAVDIRKWFPAFGKWTGVHLAAVNKRMSWIPESFEHGFIVLSDFAEFLYKTIDYWAPESEQNLAWDDPKIGIDWPFVGTPLLYPKDAIGVSIKDADLFD